jgi:1-acyl-sn-glycerol-3-phosphate acyltransferase
MGGLTHLPRALFRLCGHPLCSILTRLLYDLETRGRERIPRDGPGIIIANHTGYLDPVFLQMTTVRTIHFMLTSDFYDIPRTGWLWRLTEAIRVPGTGGARSALRRAMEILDDGGLVGVFPGRLSRTGELGEAMPGTAFMAARTGAPVIPAWIDGSFRAFGRGQRPRLATIRVRCGEALRIDRSGARNATPIRDALLALSNGHSGSES